MKKISSRFGLDKLSQKVLPLLLACGLLVPANLAALARTAGGSPSGHVSQASQSKLWLAA
jgi:hypothetical protein